MIDQLNSAILDNVTTAIVVTDREMRLRYLNPAAEALLESSGSRYIGEPLHLLFSTSDNLLSTQITHIEPSAFTQRESVLMLPSGQTLTVDYAVTPITTNGDPLFLIELHPLDRWLRISREEGLLSSQHHTRALLRGLAHEIKNPLGGIRGAAQILARTQPNDNVKECTDIIIDEADRLRNLVDRLLGPHRLPEISLVNIHEILERSRHLIEAETAGKIEFQRDYDPSIPEFSGDRQQLIQALLNIVRNAAQALTESNTDNPVIILRSRTLRQITIGSQRHKLVCRIDIIDNGPGVPDHLRDALFLPLVSGRPEGSGLGLSISQSIINHHRGLIECDRNNDKTVFSIYLPLDQSIDLTNQLSEKHE
jgi:two-component system nitrogen regulation sensor histidine kinase GlnL